MKRKHAAIVTFIIILVFCITAGGCGSPSTTYYLDDNENGTYDWGEGVWYEDDDGVHVFD